MDYLLSILIWIIGGMILPILPTEIGYIGIDEFQNTLISFREFIEGGLSFIHKFVSVQLLFGFMLTIIIGEITLFGFKAVKWLIQLVRGSG